MPDAFLRRCIFHYIDFPPREKMEEIIRVHYSDIEEKLVDAALNTFYEIREMREIQKKPSTSELLDWIMALNLSGVDIKKISDDIPFIGVLLKKNQDIDMAKGYRNVY